MKPRLTTTVLAALAAATVAAGTATTASATPAPRPTVAAAAAATGSDVHRVFATSFADPGFMKYDGKYYLYATGKGYPVTVSNRPDGGWSAPKKTMTRAVAWANGNYWAPHVFPSTNSAGQRRFVMYFTAQHATRNQTCIGAAVSASPTGGFVPQPRALVCGARGYESIDATNFTTTDGRRWIVYKNGNYNVDGKGTRHFDIRVRQVDATGTKVTGAPRVMISSSSAVVEAPSLVRRGGKVYLFVAHNGYKDCNYETQVYRADSLFGAFRLVTTLDIRAPQSNRAFCGDAGAEAISDGGTVRIAFHAYRDFTAGNTRLTWTGVLAWRADGTPYVKRI